MIALKSNQGYSMAIEFELKIPGGKYIKGIWKKWDRKINPTLVKSCSDIQKYHQFTFDQLSQHEIQ